MTADLMGSRAALPQERICWHSFRIALMAVPSMSRCLPRQVCSSGVAELVAAAGAAGAAGAAVAEGAVVTGVLRPPLQLLRSFSPWLHRLGRLVEHCSSV
jgi:ABC-type glucose/galactose transport system permease subunit